MTPTEYQDEERRLVALIRALQADIASPVTLQERIARDEAAILAMQQNIAAAKERQARLPEILLSTQARLKEHRAKKPSTNAKVERLLKLKEMMDELLKEVGACGQDS
jgi:chromosome segregation ATPase